MLHRKRTTAAFAAGAALAMLLTATTARSVGPAYGDLVYAWVGGGALELDLYLPQGVTQPVPVALYIHGGGWLSGDKYPLHERARGLLDHGFAVASINYRLTSRGGAFGGEPVVFPAQIHDVKGAIRWLRANGGVYNLDTTRIGL